MEEQHSFCLWSASGGSNRSTTNQNKRVAQSNVIRPNNSNVVAGCVFSISYKGEKEFIRGKVATDSLCRASAKKTAAMMWRDLEQKNINLHVFASCCIVIVTVFVLKSLNEMRRSRSDRQLRLLWTSPQKSASISGSESQTASSTDWWWFRDDVIKSKELVFVTVHDVLVGQDLDHNTL